MTYKESVVRSMSSRSMECRIVIRFVKTEHKNLKNDAKTGRKLRPSDEDTSQSTCRTMTYTLSVDRYMSKRSMVCRRLRVKTEHQNLKNGAKTGRKLAA